MISASLTESVMSGIFVSDTSPYRGYGFSVSLHTDVEGSGHTEVVSPSYARALVGHGPGYWSTGGRSAYNLNDIVFPHTKTDEVWSGIRSVCLWSAETGQCLWSIPLDTGPYTVGNGDYMVIPEHGMEMGIV